MADKIKRKALVDILSKIKPALSTQDFLPVLSAFCFDGDNIYAYNDVMAISFPNEIDFPFEGAISGDQFLKVLNSFKGDDIICEVKGEEVNINSGSSVIKLPLLDEDSLVWEGMPDKYEIGLRIDEDFIKGLKNCLISIGQDVLHPEHMGIQLSCDDGEVYLHSTDNITLSQYLYKDGNFDFDTVVLPELFCQQIIKLFDELEEPLLRIGKDNVCLYDEETEIVLFSKLLHSGEGSDFSKIIGKYKKALKGTFYAIEESGLIESLERALIINPDSAKGTQAKLNKGILQLKTSTDRGQVVDELVLGKSRESLEVTFTTDYVLRACKILDKISFNEDIILFKSGKSFIHLIAPRG